MTQKKNNPQLKVGIEFEWRRRGVIRNCGVFKPIIAKYSRYTHSFILHTPSVALFCSSEENLTHHTKKKKKKGKMKMKETSKSDYESLRNARMSENKVINQLTLIPSLLL